MVMMMHVIIADHVGVARWFILGVLPCVKVLL